MTDDETSRVTQVWPKTLKEKVQAHAGPRGLTEFCIAAVEQYLGVAPSFDETQTELNQTRALVQTMADKLVLGGDQTDRLQSLIEVDFPDWIETLGWPQAYADLVHARRGDSQRVAATHPEAEPAVRVPATPQPQEGAVYVDEANIVRVGPEERRAAQGKEPGPEVQVPTEPDVQLEVPVDVPTEVAPAAPGVRTDLLAKVMQATGQDLPTPLKFASEIAKPDPKDPKHNHSWERTDGVLCCECGSWIDDTDPAYPNGIVRDEGWAPETSGAGGAPDDAATSAGSEPTTPAPEPGPVMCPNDCGEALIGRECWTCS